MLAGPSQIVLLFITAVIAAISIIGYHRTWNYLEDFMVQSISEAMPAVLILLMVGALCSTWMQAGIIPTMIYYGLEVFSPRWFLVTACIICALVSLCIGSSWTTIATVGLGLMGIGRTLGLDEGWIAGSIISGAYFGDKMSPLSETTNLASTMARVPLFQHIRNMMQTTVPSISITLLIFLLVGLFSTPENTSSVESITQMQGELDTKYLIFPFLFIVPLMVFYLIYKGLPAVVVLFLGTIAAVILLLINNGLSFSMRTTFTGMSNMLNTVWLIICSMCFGGAMEASGMLGKITESILKLMSGRFKTVATTCFSSIFVNLTTGDQNLAVILPAKMYGEAYKRQNFEAKLLSRTVEDGGTVTSVLIPWNSCGMTQSTVLGVATVVYAPFAFFCWISPLMTMLFALVQGRNKKQNVSVEEQKTL